MWCYRAYITINKTTMKVAFILLVVGLLIMFVGSLIGVLFVKDSDKCFATCKASVCIGGLFTASSVIAVLMEGSELLLWLM